MFIWRSRLIYILLKAASIENIASLLENSAKSNLKKEDEFDFSSFENKHIRTVCEQHQIPSQIVQSLRPCTPVQNGMLASFTHSSGSMYFNVMALKSPVALDRVLLKESWSAVMAQHEMLRTGFAQLHDQQYPFAMITYESGVELPWYETSAGTINAQGKRVLENLHQPTWAVSVEPSETITTVHFSALHAIYDAQSLTSIFADVMASYEGKILSSRPSITATLGPILLESRNQNAEQSRQFWQSIAPEAHATKIPDLNPIRIEKKDSELLESSIRCSSPLKELETSCREMGVTLQAAGQVAWAKLLSAYTGEKNVTFGTVLSGRNLSASAQDAVFPCLVTVPSPHHIGGTNRELLERTLKRNANLVKHQFTPLAQIQRWLGSDEPLFDTLFVYQKFASGWTDVQKWDVVDEETRIDVCLKFTPHPPSLR
jgi:hypothetical protein